MNIPQNLLYTPEHEWISINGDTATVGITDYAQHELGEIVFVDVDSVGKVLAQKDQFGSLEAVKTVAELYMPVGGEVTEVNDQLTDHPELVNNDPYGEGWIIKVKVTDTTQTKNLLSSVDYQKKIA